MGMSARRSQLGGQMVPLNWFWTKRRSILQYHIFLDLPKSGISGPGISLDRLRILQSQLSSNVDLLMPLQAIEGLPRGVWVPICHSISEKC